ncbi:hypothetical protein NC652_030897 [Populus alba x Populus x berolinensis]|uniref:Uncharacterized protein n=1 Tax=Populus alba x Populus x berolinensis TaxID=444605 RepID=A0AAD6LWT4_9ROSI|nr:hypothetical protein NC652_030897 [Populus alba x Populus x berolinensis]KAJ6974696.1 hypothetical protein NC653_030731 [Populus alba x Populus x berolinensis]
MGSKLSLSHERQDRESCHCILGTRRGQSWADHIEYRDSQMNGQDATMDSARRNEEHWINHEWRFGAAHGCDTWTSGKKGGRRNGLKAILAFELGPYGKSEENILPEQVGEPNKWRDTPLRGQYEPLKKVLFLVRIRNVDSAAMVYLPVMAAHVFRFSEGDSELCLVVVVVDLSPHEGTSECWIGWHGVRSLPLPLIFVCLDFGGVEGKSFSALAFCVLSAFGSNLILIYQDVGYVMYINGRLASSPPPTRDKPCGLTEKLNLVHQS